MARRERQDLAGRLLRQADTFEVSARVARRVRADAPVCVEACEDLADDLREAAVALSTRRNLLAKLATLHADALAGGKMNATPEAEKILNSVRLLLESGQMRDMPNSAPQAETGKMLFGDPEGKEG